MSVVKTFPNRYIQKLATILMMDEEINKMLYYNGVMDKDIYSLPIVKNPVKELKDKKVFINRRVTDIFQSCQEPDVYVFVNLYSDAPCIMSKGQSLKFDTLRLDVGVICNDECRNTLNGAREAIIFERITEILREDERLEGIGKPRVSQTKQTYSIPYGWNAYIVTVQINYFNNW